MKVYLIRHGQTKGNREGRYVGRTDEPLLAESREMLSEESNLLRTVFEPDILYVSPLQRCRETARILFPGKEQTVVEALKECDFGAFEYQNYEELNGNPAYQRFIDSGGICGFPSGESMEEFQRRCVRGFVDAINSIHSAGQEKPDICAAFVVHGGTIMAVLDHFSCPHRNYFEWQTGNGCGYAAELSCDRESGNIVLKHIVDLKGILLK